MHPNHLGSAIASGKSEFDVATVRQDDKCDFGQWLNHSSAAQDRTSAHYKAAKQLHADFHTEAARVLALAVGGKKAEAEQGMALGSTFATTSGKLTHELMAWKKDAS
ncbi:MAG: CZB domain-containing protein [Solirubrobacteraceae bacterium]